MVRFIMSALLIVLLYLTILPLAVGYSHAGSSAAATPAAVEQPAVMSQARICAPDGASQR